MPPDPMHKGAKEEYNIKSWNIVGELQLFVCW